MADPQAQHQQAMSAAFQDSLFENAGLRIQAKKDQMTISELSVEIAGLKAKLTEAGIPLEDEAEVEDKPEQPAPKPNRRTRRAQAKKTPPKKTPPKGNGQAEAEAAA